MDSLMEAFIENLSDSASLTLTNDKITECPGVSELVSQMSEAMREIKVSGISYEADAEDDECEKEIKAAIQLKVDESLKEHTKKIEELLLKHKYI